jgi:ferric iron reductase protein FhuF
VNASDVAAAVAARVPYLRCATGAPGDDGWVSCATLVGDPELLRETIAATAPGRGTEDIGVAASLFVQAYAFRVPSVAVAAWALGLPVPSTAPAETAIRIRRHRPSDLAVTTQEVTSTDAVGLAKAVLDAHLGPLIDAVRVKIRVGERLLWGNAAASIATILRAVQDTGPVGDPAVRSVAAALFEAVPQFRGMGRWTTTEVPGALGWHWDRANCCLWYRTTEAAGRYCEDCSLVDATARAARRRASLEAARAGATS